MTTFPVYAVALTIDAHDTGLGGGPDTVTNVVNYVNQYHVGWLNMAAAMDDLDTAMSAYAPIGTETFYSGSIEVYSIDPVSGVPTYQGRFSTGVMSNFAINFLLYRLELPALRYIIDTIQAPWTDTV